MAFHKSPLAFFLIAGLCLFCVACVWDNTEEVSAFLPLDDSEYPYADLPRLVIETDNFSQIRDKTTKHAARVQIWGKNSPESDIMETSISGRGFSSFEMPKYGYSLRFATSTSFLKFSKGKKWDLIANYADKTLLRNYISFSLASSIGMKYTPHSEFVELYLNRRYMGVFLLAEHITVSKNRVNLPQKPSSFLLEMEPYVEDESHYISTEMGTSYKVRYPKEPQSIYVDSLVTFLNSWEKYIYNDKTKDSISNWFNLDEYIRFYWVQEFSKNNDAAYGRSVFFTWQTGSQLCIGPVWDFDVAYGNKPQDYMQSPKNWHLRIRGWNKPFFSTEKLKKTIADFWEQNHKKFEALTDSVDSYSSLLNKAVKNEYKRWNISEPSDFGNSRDIYHTHQESVDSLKSWIKQRIIWIDNNYKE